MTDSKLLRKHIKDSGLKLYVIAEKMGITRYTLSNKIENVTEFLVSEIEQICEILHIDSLEERDRIFFAKKVDK